MKVGDPITYVDTVSSVDGPRTRYRKGLYRSHVSDVLSCEVFIVTKNGSPFLAPSEEGARWVRGHYTEKSEVGQALLAAYALSRSSAA